MKKKNVNISSPDELNQHLQRASIPTWIFLGLVIIALIGFFIWSFTYDLAIKISGKASVSDGVATLTIRDRDADKLKEGQVVYINNLKGLLSFDDNNKPIASSYSLENGEYTCYVVIKENKPIDFLIRK